MTTGLRSPDSSAPCLDERQARNVFDMTLPVLPCQLGSPSDGPLSDAYPTKSVAGRGRRVEFLFFK